MITLKKQQKRNAQITVPNTFKSFIIQPTLCQNNCDYSCRHDENKHNWLINKNNKNAKSDTCLGVDFCSKYCITYGKNPQDNQLAGMYASLE